MGKKYFEDEKLEYENIDIPEELDFMINKTLKEGRAKRKRRMIYKCTGGIVASFLTFVLLVNIFPKVAYAASLIPGLDKLVELITFDKGFTNAVDKGLTKEMSYIEEKDGVKLIVNGLAGDYKRLWISYDLIGSDNYIVEAKFINKNTGEEIPSMISFSGYNGEETESAYLEIGFTEYIEEFDLELKVGKKEFKNSEAKVGEVLSENEYESSFFERENIDYITTFNVPIKLEKEIFGNVLKEIEISDNIIETEAGDIVIDKIETSKTRIVMKFNLESEIYDFMSFKNPTLVDNKGNKYVSSSSFISGDDLGNKYLEFEGELDEGIKTLKFTCDGVYYANKNDRNIKVNLEREYIEKNNYNIEFISYRNNILILKAKDIEGLTFEGVFDEAGELIISSDGTSLTSDNGENYELKSYIKIENDNLDEIELKIFWILKDLTNPVDSYLIK